MRARRPGRWKRMTATAVVILVGATGVNPARADEPQRLVVDVLQQAVDAGVAAAAADGVAQHVALVDRTTGQLVATDGGDVQVISESIVKLFTVAYYLVQYHGHLPDDMAADLHEMIVRSDDAVESRFWTTAAVPAMATRYHLGSTANGPRTGPHDWGWELITADDEALFLYRMSVDPVVGPFLMDAMSQVAPVGADGFDQHFGFNALAGAHGSKQGWTDRNTSEAINIHSVGWTARYFGAILETSDSPQYDTMRADSTATARLVAAVPPPAASGLLTTADRAALSTIAAGVGALVRHLVSLIVPGAG